VQCGGARVRLAERRHRGVVLAFVETHLADAGQRAGLFFEGAVAEVARVERGEVGRGLVVDRTHQVEPADRVQLLAQVAEHEAEDVLGLRLPALRIVARDPGGRGQAQRYRHACERGRGDHGPLALAPLRFAPGKRVVADAQQAGDELEEGAFAPVAFPARVRGERFDCAAVACRSEHGGRETLLCGIGAARFAGHDEAQHPIAAATRAERFDFGVDPARLRRRRRAHHDQRGGFAERFADGVAQVARTRQFVAVAEERSQAWPDLAMRAARADQARWHAIGFQSAQQPARPVGIGVAVAQEGAKSRGHGTSGPSG
jgi:hypothetical protein